MGKKEDILDATMAIIASEGVMSATIANILKKANTGYGTLYNYFDSKEALYLALYIEIVKGIDDYIKRGLKANIGSEEALRTILKRYINYCFEQTQAFNALEALRFIPGICSSVEAYDQYELDFFEFIESCEAEGIIKRRDPYYNTNIMMGMIAAFIKYYAISSDEVEDAKKDDIIDSCIKALQ